MDTLVAISNVDRPPKSCGRVQYAKLRNIRWEKIRNILKYDIMQVTVHKENGGLFIQIFDRERKTEYVTIKRRGEGVNSKRCKELPAKD